MNSPAGLLDPHARVFVAKRSPKVEQHVLPQIPRSRVFHAVPEHSSVDAPFYYANSEAHAIPGGGIAYRSGRTPLHNLYANNANYVRK